MKKWIYLLWILGVSEVMAQTEQYPVKIEEDLTIMFPAKPVIEDYGFRKSYVAETSQGMFSVVVGNLGSDEDSLFSANDIDKLLDSYINNSVMTDPNLGNVSTTQKMTIGSLKGVYYRMELGTSDDEPPMIMMALTLVRPEPRTLYTIVYQYFDTGQKALYDKESFLAAIHAPAR